MERRRFQEGSDLTAEFQEKLLVKVFSWLDVFDLFVARMVCARWRKMCEHPDLYRSIDMQNFMMYNRYPSYNVTHIHFIASIFIIYLFYLLYSNYLLFHSYTSPCY